MFNEFSNLVNIRQACRKFNDKPVEKEKLDKILDLSRLAPSACNSQPWKVYCVTSTCVSNAVRESLQGDNHNKFLDEVNTFICVSEIDAKLRSDVGSAFDNNHFVKYDIGEIVAYITLSAKALGLDTCVIGWIDEEKLAKALNLTENEKCNLVIAVGYSDIPVREKIRKPFEETIKYL
jgi:nitroreductase